MELITGHFQWRGYKRMTYSDIVQLILIKLDITEDDAAHDGTLNKIAPLINEALGNIANKGKPFYQLEVFNVFLDGTDINTIAADELGTNLSQRIIPFSKNFISLTNEYILFVPIGVVDGKIVENGVPTPVDGREFRRMTSNKLIAPVVESTSVRYYFQTMARYPQVSREDPDAELDIEQSVLDLVPNYVISEILRNIDLTTSAYYRNMYEDGVANLNDSVLHAAGALYSEGY